MEDDHKYIPPEDALEALARILYPAMVSYFEREEGQREFAEWQKQQGRASSKLEEVKLADKSGQVA